MLSALNERPLWMRVGLLLVVLGVVAGFVFVPAVVIGPAPPDWSPQWLTYYAHDARLYAFAPQAKMFFSFINGSFADDRIYAYGDTTTRETVRFPTEDGLTLDGTLYRPDEVSGEVPAVLMLHGSTPEGRFMGMYRALSNELAKAGYIVLTIDQRGYGTSDEPDPKDASTFRYAEDVADAVDYMLTLENVDPDNVFVLGHSFGGDVAIAGGVRDDRIAGIISFSPARDLVERAEEEVDYFRRRDMRYLFLGRTIPPEVFMAYRVPLLIDSNLDYFEDPDHKPLLLLDGELESESDREWLTEIAEQIGGDATHITLEGADHYANVAGVAGPLIIYDEPAFENLVDVVTGWLAEKAG